MRRISVFLWLLSRLRRFIGFSFFVFEALSILRAFLVCYAKTFSGFPRLCRGFFASKNGRLRKEASVDGMRGKTKRQRERN